MIEIELEKTYLAKALPPNLLACPFKEVADIYIPKKLPHPNLRIRQKGDKYEITKKTPVNGTDSSEQSEHTIVLTKEEFEDISGLDGKKVRKFRYYYDHNGIQAEVDVFKDNLEGLVLVDFEFKEIADKDSFKMPDFCLADVTQDAHFAGGILAGKKLADLLPFLEEYGYHKL